MSTHNIGFYEELKKLSFNYHQIHTLPVLLEHVDRLKIFITLMQYTAIFTSVKMAFRII